MDRKDLESFLISWNIKFRYDRLWRQKYSIPFGSKEHLEMSQIDIFLDILEDKLFEKAQKAHFERLKDLEEFSKTGKILKEEVLSPEEEDKLFKKINYKNK